MPAWLKWWTWITGHLGFLARGGVFMCVAILFFRAVQDQNASHRKTAIGDALDQLKVSACVLLPTRMALPIWPHCKAAAV